MTDKEKHMSWPVNEPKLWPVPTFWTVNDVHKYICDLGYQKYAKCFTENAVVGRDLLNINAFDLQRLGVSKMEDAIRLSGYIRKTATTLMTNWDDPDKPLNVLYYPGFTMPPNEEATLPPIHSLRNLTLPYRDQGDRSYRYHLPVQSYHDHCMVIGRTDVWKLYNSKF